MGIRHMAVLCHTYQAKDCQDAHAAERATLVLNTKMEPTLDVRLLRLMSLRLRWVGILVQEKYHSQLSGL